MIALVNSRYGSSADFPQLTPPHSSGLLFLLTVSFELKTSVGTQEVKLQCMKFIFSSVSVLCGRGFVKICPRLPAEVLRCKLPRYSFLLTDVFLQSPILLEHRKLWLISKVCEFSRFNSFTSRTSIPQNGAFHPDFSASAWSPGRDVSLGTCVIQVTFCFPASEELGLCMVVLCEAFCYAC